MIKYQKKIKLLFFFVVFWIAATLLVISLSPGISKKTIASKKNNALPAISKSELIKFNGEDSKKPIYIALEGFVYDVTAGKKFYVPGAPYHYLAGKDSTQELKLFGANLIKNKYPVVAVLQ